MRIRSRNASFLETSRHANNIWMITIQTHYTTPSAVAISQSGRYVVSTSAQGILSENQQNQHSQEQSNVRKRKCNAIDFIRSFPWLHFPDTYPAFRDLSTDCKGRLTNFEGYCCFLSLVVLIRSTHMLALLLAHSIRKQALRSLPVGLSFLESGRARH